MPTNLLKRLRKCLSGRSTLTSADVGGTLSDLFLYENFISDSRPDENVQEAKRDKVEIKSAKSVQDMKFDFSPHHRAHLKTDHHAPLHFEDLSAEEEDGKSDTESKQALLGSDGFKLRFKFES